MSVHQLKASKNIRKKSRYFYDAEKMHFNITSLFFIELT